MATLTWRMDESEDVTSTAQLQALLAALRQEADAGGRPFTVDLTLDNGDSLSAGLGLPASVMNCVGASGNPPYYVSEGDGTAWDAEVIEFDYGGEMTEYPGEAAVPTDVAVDGLLSFFESGERPGSIRWREV